MYNIESMETWQHDAEAFLARYQWGPNSKFLGVSRMLDNIQALSKGKYVVSQRPRGVLSGFLAILPQGTTVYLPPVLGKIGPKRIRLRHRVEKGAIFSAYWFQNKLILEDVLVWNSEPVWFQAPFQERWKIMQTFLHSYYHKDPVQGFELQFAKYQSLGSLQQPADNMVMEFVPNEPKLKRLIWSQDRKSQPRLLIKPDIVQKLEFTARKDASAGPDVYTVYRGVEKLGYGVVKTLAISKALRAATDAEIKIDAVWSEQFHKWEIKQVF
jgi:hypothetical protein